jgi:hypothetical protein
MIMMKMTKEQQWSKLLYLLRKIRGGTFGVVKAVKEEEQIEEKQVEEEQVEEEKTLREN